MVHGGEKLRPYHLAQWALDCQNACKIISEWPPQLVDLSYLTSVKSCTQQKEPFCSSPMINVALQTTVKLMLYKIIVL